MAQGGGGPSQNGHGRSSSVTMNGHLAGMKEISAEDMEAYENGIQVIDEDKAFTPNLPVYLSTQNLLTAGFSYHVVAVFGSQSTGKSTLLNHLFGTRFSVMDETARRQTTKGIWMSRAVEELEDENRGVANNILVMDVEGTDGRERGEDQDFERKSALFALATSEVMIVNIWEHQVGLYQGANMGLLKTVFEVNLGLFLKDQSTTHRSLLFFVIRDHIGNTPLSNLANTLLTDLSHIWDALSKPPGLESTKISDFFDFDFVALPHKLLQPDKFLEETQKLRRRFRVGVPPELSGNGDGNGTDSDGGVFLPAYHRRIPADGFPLYAEGVWEQIVTNKDLDLPSQQELLAQYRCDEIAATCVAGFNEIIEPFEAQAASGKVLHGLGPALKKAFFEATDGFEEAGGRYHKAVFQRKRDDLRKLLEGRLKALIVGHLSALAKRAVQEFTEEVATVLKKANSNAEGTAASYNFAALVKETRAKVVQKFMDEAGECHIPGHSWSSFDDEQSMLEKDLDEVAARLRREEMKRLVSRSERNIRNKLAEPVELEFRRLEDTKNGALWDRVWGAWTGVVEDTVDSFLSRARSFNATEEENEIGVWRLKKKAWKVLKGKIDEEVMEGNLLLKLRENFEDRFRYDEHGVPRVWKPTDDIEGNYTRAREATLKLIPLLSHIKLASGSEPSLADFIGPCPASEGDENEDEESTGKSEFEVLSEAKQDDLATRFKRMADAVYVEAKRSTISSVGQIPLYFYGLLLALGWNELLAVLMSPLYFMFSLVCLVLAYVIYYLNLWGPILRVLNAMSQQVMDIGKERLRDFLKTDDPAAIAGRQGRRGRDDLDGNAIGLQTLDNEGRKKIKAEPEDD